MHTDIAGTTKEHILVGPHNDVVVIAGSNTTNSW